MNHSRSRRFLSVLLSILMMLSSIGIPAYAEVPATPTDLQPAEEQPAEGLFEQKTGVDGVHFVITADSDVFEPGARLDIERIMDDAAFEQASEIVTGIRNGAQGDRYIRHMVYRISGTEFSGIAKFQVSGLDFILLQEIGRAHV